MCFVCLRFGRFRQLWPKSWACKHFTEPVCLIFSQGFSPFVFCACALTQHKRGGTERVRPSGWPRPLILWQWIKETPSFMFSRCRECPDNDAYTGGAWPVVFTPGGGERSQGASPSPRYYSFLPSDRDVSNVLCFPSTVDWLNVLVLKFKTCCGVQVPCGRSAASRTCSFGWVPIDLEARALLGASA